MRRAGWGLSARSLASVLILIAWVVLLQPLVCAARSTIELNSAEFTLDASTSPPSAAAAWQPQPLPDNWNLSRPGQGGNGWYRLRFDLPEQPGSLYAVYVRKLSMNAAFYVNGNLIGSGGRFDEPVARHWNRPQFFTLSAQLLNAGENVMHVRLWAYPDSRGGLGETEIGPEDELRSEYERRHFAQIVLPQLCNIVIAASGLIAFALWTWRRDESYYVCFSVFTLLWALRSTHMYVREIPVSAFHWDIWVQSSFGWCALVFILFAMRYSELRWPRFEKALLAYAVIGPVVMWSGGPARLHAIASAWSFVIVPIAMVFEGVLIRGTLRKRTLDEALVVALFGLVIAASVHDGLVHRDRLAFDSYYTVSYVMVLLALAVGWQQANRLGQALNTAEKLNLDLEQRVAEKHAELSANFQRIQDMQRDSAIAAERQRIMSEMHDGIGSQLIATLDLMEHTDAPRTQIADELREVLDSVRLTVDSLEPSGDDLLSVLGNLRYRLEGRLKRQGIALNWRVQDLPRLASLTPGNVLHILRILQEAFANIAKHARAKTITVQTGHTDEHVFIRVADDGCGYCTGREGRGLVSMRRRARALGAKLAIVAAPLQ